MKTTEWRIDKINKNLLIYLSMFFVLYPDITFGKNNFFSNKSLAIWLCMLFVVMTFKTFCKNIRLNEILCAIVLLVSICIGYLLGGFDNGLGRQINGYIGFVSVYIAIKNFCINANRNEILKLLKVMYLSYIAIIFLFGGGQVIYIYGGNIGILGEIFSTILWRGYEYFVDIGWGRVCATFSEPSMMGTYFYAYFVPVHLLCRKYKLFNLKKMNIIFIALLCINMLSLSGRWFFDTLACGMIYLLCTIKYSRSRTNEVLHIICRMLIVGAIGYIAVQVLIPQEINNYIERFNSLIDNLDFYSELADGSFMVRLVLINAALLSFYDNPFLGIGMGNFHDAMQLYAIIPYNPLARVEILGILDMPDITSYSFYFTSLGEMGVLGGIFIILVMYNFFKAKVKEFRLLAWIIAYLFVQTELYGALIFAVWLGIINSFCFVSRGEYLNNENFHNNTMS